MITENEIRESLSRKGVPAHLHEGIVNYMIHRVMPGHFLTAVLSNDLVNAVRRGDVQAMAGIVPLVKFLDNDAPAGCWGSNERISDWLNGRFA